VYTRGWHGNGVDKYPGTAPTSDFVVVVVVVDVDAAGSCPARRNSAEHSALRCPVIRSLTGGAPHSPLLLSPFAAVAPFAQPPSLGRGSPRVIS